MEYTDFAWALQKLRGNFKVARRGWNGKTMWIALQRPDQFSKMTMPYIYICTSDGRMVPWVASQTDLLSDDWFKVEG